MLPFLSTSSSPSFLAFLISAINPSLSEEAESYKLEIMSTQSQISTDVPESNTVGFSFP